MNTGARFRSSRAMTKDELVDHLNAAHFKRPVTDRERRYWTKESLADSHRLAHVSLGASADHEHR